MNPVAARLHRAEPWALLAIGTFNLVYGVIAHRTLLAVTGAVLLTLLFLRPRRA